MVSSGFRKTLTKQSKRERTGQLFWHPCTPGKSGGHLRQFIAIHTHLFVRHEREGDGNAILSHSNNYVVALCKRHVADVSSTPRSHHAMQHAYTRGYKTVLLGTESHAIELTRLLN